MSGPELHANTIATLQDRAFITTPWWLSSLLWFLVFGAAWTCFLPIGARCRVSAGHRPSFRLEGIRLGRIHIWICGVEMGGMLVLGAMAYSVAFAWRWRVLRQVLRAVKSAPIAQGRNGSGPLAAGWRVA